MSQHSEDGQHDADVRWMRLAVDEAAKGEGKTAPNPPVGAVIVKDGVCLGRGWHRAAGQPHAEREALAEVVAAYGKDGAQGATAYVTLEPCSSFGRTPPCTQGLIDAGIKRVVYACVDPNQAHAGRADSLLRAAGIEVCPRVGEALALPLLRPFFKVQTTGLPWVIWKTAMSLDGKLTRPPGEGQWLTSALARADVQKLRSKVDAILTTGETVRRDLPALTIRQPECLAGRKQPWRVVFTRKPESLPMEAPLFTDEFKDRTLLRQGDHLADVLRGLVAEQGVLSVMTEAGGVFSDALFQAGLVDEVVAYYAPLMCGGPNAALGGAGLSTPVHCEAAEFTQLGDDIRLRALVKKTGV